ncbi:unnamed protein product [Coccothraustes coccothraustes]
MLALREAEHTNLKLPEAKRPSRAAFSRSRALESTATGTMLGPVAGCFQQEPRFGEHRHRHNAQSAKKPLLRFREPDSAAAAETRRAKPHITGNHRAALKHIKDGTFPELRFGEHRHRHNAQCAKKVLLRLRELDSVAAAET